MQRTGLKRVQQQQFGTDAPTAFSKRGARGEVGRIPRVFDWDNVELLDRHAGHDAAAGALWRPCW